MKLSVPFYQQEHTHTCVPACLRMVLAFFGAVLTEDDLAQRCGTTVLRKGRVELAQAAKGFGWAVQLVDNLANDDVAGYLNQGRPVIAWIDPSLLYPGVFGCSHAVVIVGLDPNTVLYHDPEVGGDLVAAPRSQGR